MRKLSTQKHNHDEEATSQVKSSHHILMNISEPEADFQAPGFSVLKARLHDPHGEKKSSLDLINDKKDELSLLALKDPAHSNSRKQVQL